MSVVVEVEPVVVAVYLKSANKNDVMMIFSLFRVLLTLKRLLYNKANNTFICEEEILIHVNNYCKH